MLLTSPLSNLDWYGLNLLFSFTFFFLKCISLITNHCWMTFRRYCKGVYAPSLVKCVSAEGLLMEAWDRDEEKLELWGIELQKLHLYKQLKARWYSVQMFPISKNSLESHLLLTRTNSAYNFSSTWRIAQIKKTVLVKKEKCTGAIKLWNKCSKWFCQPRICLWHLIHKIKWWNNWFLPNSIIQASYLN